MERRLGFRQLLAEHREHLTDLSLVVRVKFAPLRKSLFQSSIGGVQISTDAMQRGQPIGSSS